MIPENVARLMATRPEVFIKFFWPNMLLYDRQIEIIRSVAENKETFVHAGHKVGKDRVAALVALWFFCTRSPGRVLITSSTEAQLRDTLWSEMLDLSRSAMASMGISFSHMLIRKVGEKPGEFVAKDYIVGIVANQGETFHGHHLDSSVKPRVLVIMSEASGIDDVYYEAAQSQAHRILATGNPVSTGFFRRQCLRGNAKHPLAHGLLRKVIHIDGEYTPNVIAGKAFVARGGVGNPPTIVPGVLTYEEYLERLEWPRDQREKRLHGRWMSDKEQLLFPDEWLNLAQAIGARIQEKPGLDHGSLAMGVDVAQGGDASVWTAIGRYGVKHKYRKHTVRTSEIVGLTMRLCDRWNIEPENVMFDAGGGGREHADQLRDRGYEVDDVNFGSKPNIPAEYTTMRAEMYGEASKKLEPTAIAERMSAVDVEKWPPNAMALSIPPDDAKLREDLNVLPKLTDGEDRLRLPPKDRRKGSRTSDKTVKELLGRSPDDGDSFVLGVYAYDLMMDRSTSNDLVI